MVKEIIKNNDEYMVLFENGEILIGDCVFFVGGCVLNIENLGLENINVELDEKGFIKVDKY